MCNLIDLYFLTSPPMIETKKNPKPKKKVRFKIDEKTLLTNDLIKNDLKP